MVTERHLPADMSGPGVSALASTPAPGQTAESETGNLSLPPAIEALEKKLIAQALDQCKGNKSRAARVLGISERSLWYKLSRYKL